MLLKANAQAVPTYPMSCFKLSPIVCRKLTTAVSNYWWGSSLDNHKLHWLRWEKLTRSKSQGGIGFRDFALFNQAMLGKQGWRLMMRPSSLCARVLKGKYYLNSDFLSATKKKRSSETWRSILHGREVLKKGLIKRIGPGDTSIWQENWIPGLQSLRPVVRLQTASAEMVNDLFIPGTRVWDERVVRRSFISLEANEVLNIKPGQFLENDILAWAFERHGIYSVRSAYKLLKNEQMAEAMASTGETRASGDDRAWSLVWKLDVPPKVCVFWWRVLHNSLPSKAELKRQHIAKESFCECCGEQDESVYHVVNSCPMAKRFWSEVKKATGFSVPLLHPSTWATDVLHPETCPPAKAALVVCGAWVSWTGRNARNHGRKVWELGASARYVAGLLEELALLKPHQKASVPRRKAEWQRPAEGWIKANTDAAFDASTFTGSGGVVICDHRGSVLAGAARWFDNVPDALTAEALAAKEGLELAMENGYDKVILEVDCSNLKSLIANDTGWTSAIGGLCFDITELSRNFAEFKVEWVYREANSVGHCCASMVSCTERASFWLDHIPEWLEILAATDCNPA